ncbi:MAG: Ig-like domain-containing protein, partial [Gammaproteobacteria bacterium]
TAVARDAAGNIGTSAGVTVTANNPPVSTITIGETSILSVNDGNNANLLFAQPATLSQTATIQSLSFYVVTASGNLRLGIYDATGPGGRPGAKKAETASITPTTGWNTANVITPVSLPAGTYWLAYLASSSSLGFKAESTGGNSKLYPFTFGTMPATFSTAPGSSVWRWSLYATLTLNTPDTTPPTASITAPTSGATVSGTAVTVAATASDTVGVAGVQFKLDGTNLGAEDTTAPYSVTWNSTTATNGSHTLTARARCGRQYHHLRDRLRYRQ